MLKVQAYTLFSVMIFTAMWTRIVFTENEASVLMVGIAIVYGICLYMYRQDLIRTPIFIANGLLALLILMQLLVDDLLFEGIIGVSVIYLLIYKKFTHKLHIILFGFSYFVGFYYVLLISITSWFSWEMLHWIVFIAATAYEIYILKEISKQKKYIVFNIGVPYIGFLLLYFLHMIAIIISGELGSNLERVFTSSLWVIVAILFMVGSRRLLLEQGKYVGVGILFFTLAKIILFDIPFVSVAIKALLFIVLGIVGLIVSRAYYKK
jgi:hypothetical protein